MHLYLVLLFVLGMNVGNGHPLPESGSVSRRILEEQNSESIKKPLQDIEASDDDSSEEDEKWMKDIEDRFTASLIRLLEGGDELYKDERFEGILKTLKGVGIDEDYVRKFIETLRKQDAAKRKQFDEVMMNKLELSKSDYQDFLEKFVKEMKSGSPTISKSV